MRSIILSAAVLAGALGITAATPSEAKAYYPVMFNSGYRVGNYGYYNAYYAPQYNWYINRWGGYGQMIYQPGYYRTQFTPQGWAALYASRSYLSYNYNPIFGYRLNVATPAYWGYNVNPYLGYSNFYRPGVSYSVPLGGGYGVYVPPTYIVR